MIQRSQPKRQETFCRWESRRVGAGCTARGE